jgi:hypothetical protein
MYFRGGDGISARILHESDDIKTQKIAVIVIRHKVFFMSSYHLAVFRIRDIFYGSGADPDPYLWLTDPDVDPRGPRT